MAKIMAARNVNGDGGRRNRKASIIIASGMAEITNGRGVVAASGAGRTVRKNLRADEGGGRLLPVKHQLTSSVKKIYQQQHQHNNSSKKCQCVASAIIMRHGNGSINNISNQHHQQRQATRESGKTECRRNIVNGGK